MHLITRCANSFEILFEEIAAWFHDFFNPELEGYVNFDFGGGSLVNIHVIVFGIFIGVFVASFYMVYVKNFVGAFVRKLLSEGCLSAEKAKTLAELGFEKNVFVRSALRGSLLATTVSRAEPSTEALHIEDGREEKEEDPSTEGETNASAENGEKPPVKEKEGAVEGSEREKETAETKELPSEKAEAVSNVRYYIKEEKKYVAEMRFNARGSGWPTLLFVLLISIFCIFVIFAFLPQILRFLDNTISIFSVKGNTIK